MLGGTTVSIRYGNMTARNMEVDVFCEHGIQKYTCRECDGGALCEHHKYKYFCLDCGGRGLCQTPHCTTIKNIKDTVCFALSICIRLSL